MTSCVYKYANLLCILQFTFVVESGIVEKESMSLGSYFVALFYLSLRYKKTNCSCDVR